MPHSRSRPRIQSAVFIRASFRADHRCAHPRTHISCVSRVTIFLVTCPAWSVATAGTPAFNNRQRPRAEDVMDEKDLDDAAREEMDALPAETAAGNEDADSAGLDEAFPDAD